MTRKETMMDQKKKSCQIGQILSLLWKQWNIHRHQKLRGTCILFVLCKFHFFWKNKVLYKPWLQCWKSQKKAILAKAEIFSNFEQNENCWKIKNTIQKFSMMKFFYVKLLIVIDEDDEVLICLTFDRFDRFD